MSRSTIGIAVCGVLVLFAGVGAGAYLAQQQSSSSTATSSATSTPVGTSSTIASTTPTKGSIDLFGTMLAYQTSQGFAGNKAMEDLAQESWLTLRNSTSYSSFTSRMTENFTRNAALAAQTGFSSNRDVVGAFAWNVIQPEKGGAYDWDIPDKTMAAAGKAGQTFSAVIQPFAAWDTKERIDPDHCVGIDFVYFDYAAGKPVDMDAYEAWIAALVERYDHDGVDDMPGLTTKVSHWEVGNEVEGSCGGTLLNSATYISLLKSTYNTIKAADATALVLNAGALEILGERGDKIAQTSDFWNEFFAQNGPEYLDIFNIHYNRERAGASSTLAAWEQHLAFFRNLLDDTGHTATPLWLTEYGTYSGSPKAKEGRDGVSISYPTQSAATQQSWYFRTAVSGMSYGAERYFVDLSGNDDSGIGGSALFSGNGKTARPFVQTLIMLGTQLHDVTATEKLADGQYVFTLSNGTVAFALWSGDVPQGLRGKPVVVYDVNGVETSENGTDIVFSETSPKLVIL